MGAGASIGEVPEGHTKYHCHECHQEVFIPNGGDIACPHCRSSFLEESMDHSIVPFGRTNLEESDRGSGGMTLNQSRRLANAAIMLRILEAQLREELDTLQSNMDRDNDDKKKKGLTKCMKVSIKNISADLDMICDQPSCPICNIDYEVGEDLKSLPCGHCYHDECVLPWLEMKRTCPICRAELQDNVPSISQLKTRSEKELSDYFTEYDISLPKGADTIQDKAEVLYKYLEDDKVEREAEREVSSQNSSNSSNFDPRSSALVPLMRLGAALSGELPSEEAARTREERSQIHSNVMGGGMRMIALSPSRSGEEERIRMEAAARAEERRRESGGPLRVLSDLLNDQAPRNFSSTSESMGSSGGPNIRIVPVNRTFIVRRDGSISNPLTSSSDSSSNSSSNTNEGANDSINNDNNGQSSVNEALSSATTITTATTGESTSPR